MAFSDSNGHSDNMNNEHVQLRQVIQRQIQQYKHVEKPDLMTTIQNIQAGAKTGSTKALAFYGLSGLGKAEIEHLAQEWQTLDEDYRLKLVRRLAEATETNYELDYHAVGLFSTYDSNPLVREAAIDILWEDETIEVMDRFIELAANDQSTSVREAALKSLERFILKGELGELPEIETIRAQQIAVSMLNAEHEAVEIRRRALEAIANCSHEVVPGAIQTAYRTSERIMKLGAVYAMGRTCDDRWEAIIIDELDSTDDEMCFEAVRAAGELQLGGAVSKLGRIVTEADAEIQDMAIWSLGEIGGREALRILRAVQELAEENEDEDLISAIEDAIGNASMAGGDLFADIDLQDFN